MRVDGKVVVVTGGGNGIGRAMALRFHRENAAAVVIADLDENAGNEAAALADGTFVSTNVAKEDDVRALVKRTTRGLRAHRPVLLERRHPGGGWTRGARRHLAA
jgi:NAD(P)-dependent dehydrogenase (short-subunit alcohol dehydrogenase family)